MNWKEFEQEVYSVCCEMCPQFKWHLHPRLGKDLFGRQCRPDLVGYNKLTGEPGLIIECKWQTVAGTAENKVVYALETVRGLSEQFNCPAELVYGGGGWSSGAYDYLQSHIHASEYGGQLIDLLKCVNRKD